VPLQLVPPPPGADRIAAGGLAECHRHASPQFRGLASTPLANLALSVPHPVHFLTLEDASLGHLTDSGAVTRWRFLVQAEDRTVASVDVRTDPASGALRFAAIEEGPFVQGTMDAIHVAESLPEIGAGEFAVSLLCVPALSVIALWLRSNLPNRDLFLTLSPAPTRFKPLHPYSAHSFLGLLRAEADAHPAFDSSPQVAVPAD
jgi:hypothetical protein